MLNCKIKYAKIKVNLNDKYYKNNFHRLKMINILKYYLKIANYIS